MYPVASVAALVATVSEAVGTSALHRLYFFGIHIPRLPRPRQDGVYESELANPVCDGGCTATVAGYAASDDLERNSAFACERRRL